MFMDFCPSAYSVNCVIDQLLGWDPSSHMVLKICEVGEVVHVALKNEDKAKVDSGN
jgi:hypothetical protein